MQFNYIYFQKNICLCFVTKIGAHLNEAKTHPNLMDSYEFINITKKTVLYSPQILNDTKKYCI